jgi:hypothetical protein
MASDLRVGLRLLLKDKAFTITAAATLAMCIGANTALFSVVHNVLLRPLPVPDSQRLVLMSNTYPKAGAEGLGSSGVPDYYDRIRDVAVLEDQAVYQTRTMAIDQNGTPARVLTMIATPSLFHLIKGDSTNRPNLFGYGRRDRQRAARDPQLCPMAVGVRRRSSGRWQRRTYQQPALHHRRCDAARVPVYGTRRDVVDSRCLYSGSKERRTAP